jgi:DNA polymerase-4
LRERPLRDLERAVGNDAFRLARLAAGDDSRRVEPMRETKSISAETTMGTDISALAELEPILWKLCEKVSTRLKRAGLAGQSITLKLKDRNFRLRTRTRSGCPPTQLASRLFESARDMLRDNADGTAYRLIGIGAGDLCDAAEADRGDLADMQVVEARKIEAALDSIRERFGRDAVQKGLAFPFGQR